VGLLVTVFFALGTLGYFNIPGIALFETQLYDLKVKLSAHGVGQSNVVILDVDEKSLAVYGRWPWTRSVIAKINDKLFNEYKVSALGYDIVWAERDNVNPTNIMKDLNLSLIDKSPHYSEFISDIQKLDSDKLFAESLKDRSVVLGYYFNNEKDAQITNVLPSPVLSLKDLPNETNNIIQWNAYTGNLKDLTESAASGGYFNPTVDEDGVIRRVPLLARYGDHYYQSLTLGIVRAALGQMPVKPIVATDGQYSSLEGLEIGPISIPVDDKGSALIPYHGKAHSFKYISVKDLLEGKVQKTDLESKIVIMGSSAPGLRDQRSTPLQNVFPGVEIHANLIDGILGNHVKQMPEWGHALEFVLLVFAGLMLSLLLPVLGPVTSVIAAIVFLAIGSALNFYLWDVLNLVVPTAAALATTIMVILFDTSIAYFMEGRQQKNMANLFGQYVPPELVRKMAEDPLKYSMEGRDANLSVLFSDVRGFTSISEKLTASQLSSYINEYLTTMSTLISEESGTLDKYIGDAIMAFWGAPIDNEKHASESVGAALKMSQKAHELSLSFAERDLPPFNIGIGINSGHMRVGDMGSQYRRVYTVMGDPVNLASR